MVLLCFENEVGRRVVVLCSVALSWRALPDVVSVVGGPFATSKVLLRLSGYGFVLPVY
jgi:hypothetical protein